MDPVIETTEASDESDDAQADAAFAEGFGQPETPTEETPPAVEDLPETLESEPVATPETPAPVELTKLDEAQIQRILAAADELPHLKASVSKLNDTTFGRIGRLEEAIKQKAEEKAQAGQAMTFTADDFAELKADFPDLAEMQAKGFNRALSKLKGTAPTFDPAQVGQLVEQQVSQRVQAIEEKSALQVADLTMPGWREDVNQPAFKAWFAEQKLPDTWEPVQIQRYLSDFKKTTQAKPKTPPATSRRERLAEAVIPRGAGGHAPAASSEEDAFQTAYAESR